MTPTYYHSHANTISPIPADQLNDYDQNQYFNTNPHQASSSSSSLSFPVLFNSPQDQGGSSYWELRNLQNDEEAEKIIPFEGSWDHPEEHNNDSKKGLKLRVRKKEDKSIGYDHVENNSINWMSSNMKVMRKMIVLDKTDAFNRKSEESALKLEDHVQKQPLSPSETDQSSNNPSSQNNMTTVRVCADCNTTKTPLWRSGPRGPKSLCNACGIRQRKARRAMAVAVAARNGIVMPSGAASKKGKVTVQKDKQQARIGGVQDLKKKCKLGAAKPTLGRKKLSLEDLWLSLSGNMAFQQVFPQDEKEAALLLMALSYGLLNG